MSKKICLAMHSRNFGSEKIVRTLRTYVHPFMKAGVKFCISSTRVVSLAAVFSIVTQRSSPLGALRDDTKNGCEGD